MFKKIFWYLLIIVLFTLSFAMIFNKPIEHYVIKNYKPTISREIIAKSESEKVVKSEFNWNKSKPLSSSGVLSGIVSRPGYIGLVCIPDLDINLPISKGTSDDSLSLGAGTLYQDQKMGEDNYSLASHFVQGSNHKNLLFSPIYYRGTVGEKIYLTDLKNVYVYETTSVKIVRPTDIDVTNPVNGKKLVTLITCDYTADQGRIVMQGQLKEVTSWNKASTYVHNQFSKKAKVL
ncbi:Sortase A, LPXTG specific [Leuconostoc gelidum subsp. gasicomitatum]|uniref:Sortase A, LPXTG specific n=1 Tax=Leuconostoc gasicomitatum TaxID=115778 RepID=A0ABM9V3B4_9LACO|nr:class A sortase [Leuconostoc gasicomitatum]CUR63174.1 Sortase 1 SrtA1 [Leuconostoc gasicomitatum KG16-1]CUW09858.1 Sortase A, LPXTG specific [Leuconostoc gasicomitatum]